MNRLWVKLPLSFLAIALVAVGVVALLSARVTGDQFRQYVVHSNMMAQSLVVESLTAY
jgi:ABC-type transporter Mla subunit MlaD